MLPLIDYDYAGSYFQHARPELEALIPPGSRRILDVGCGAGALGRSYKGRHQCYYEGIEPDVLAAATARGRIDGVHTTTAEAFAGPHHTQKPDCIIFADVLEHLQDPLEILKKFKDYLSPGGTILASVPNVAHPTIQRELSSGLFRYTNAGLLDKTHLRFFTSISLQQLFVAAGLRIKQLSAHPSNADPYQFLITAEIPKDAPANLEMSILILNWNTLAHLQNCINSIRASSYWRYVIFVLDQGGRPDSIAWIRSQPDVLAIHSPINYGFPIGNNLLINCVSSPYILLCNSDIIFPSHAIQYLIDDLTAAPVHSIVGPSAPNVSGNQALPAVPAKDLNSLTQICDSHRSSFARILVPLHRLVFFCTLFRSDTFRRVGMLDEAFTPGNFEDDDFCVRAIQAGYHLYFSPSIYVHHAGHGAHTANNMHLKPLLERNYKIFLQKHGHHYQQTTQNFYRDNPNAIQLPGTPGNS